MFTCDAFGLHYCDMSPFDVDLNKIQQHYRCVGMGARAHGPRTALQACLPLACAWVCASVRWPASSYARRALACVHCSLRRIFLTLTHLACTCAPVCALALPRFPQAHPPLMCTVPSWEPMCLMCTVPLWEPMCLMCTVLLWEPMCLMCTPALLAVCA